MITYSKTTKDSRVEFVIVEGHIIGVIIRGSATAYFKPRLGVGTLYPDASVARAALESGHKKEIRPRGVRSQ